MSHKTKLLHIHFTKYGRGFFMDINNRNEYAVYKDIQDRTGGEIYIGVVGPVRTGKSTFIKRFMDLLVLPFMVDGASGHMEENEERLVKTPWSAEEIPFTKAAEIGTRKVIKDHSTIGIVITCDGSFGELSRNSFLEAEERTIKELQEIHKPFLIHDKYQVTVMPVNCEQLKQEDINRIMENILYEFPLTMIEFYMPKWVEMLSFDHKMKQDIISRIKVLMSELTNVRDITKANFDLESEYIRKCKLDGINMSEGSVKIVLDLDDTYYYEMISDLVGEPITSEYQMLSTLKEMARMKREYTKVLHAMESVRYKGYGVVMPDKEEIVLEKPEVIKQGNKFGVKIKAESPSIHMIKASIETEISPIVGTETQAKDLIQYISETGTSDEGIWETNIFGKTIEQLVNDGISTKIAMINEESQVKLQETMQKIVNDSNGGMVCIII